MIPMNFRKLFPDVGVNTYGSVDIYTDGSCIGNGQPDAVGGWAYIIVDDATRKNPEDIYRQDSGSEFGTTNNRMEMTAVLEALKVADPKFTTIVHSDSKYVIETLNGHFKIGKNIPLWAEIKHEVRRFKDIHFVWVKGHAEDMWNIAVDKLATTRSNELQQQRRLSDDNVSDS